MTLIVLALFLLVGFIVADAMIDYIFVIIYALAATAILNNFIHVLKYYKKHGKLCISDLSSSFCYILMGVGIALVRYIWF